MFEMFRDGSLNFGIAFTVVQCVSLSVLCFLLARSKNRNLYISSIGGLLPGLNYLVVLYYVGVPALECRTKIVKGD